MLSSPDGGSTDLNLASTDAPTQQTRSLLIKQNGVEFTVPVPLPLWPIAEQVRELFPPATDTEVTPMEFAALFLDFAISRIVVNNRIVPNNEIIPFAAAVFKQFHVQFLKNNNIHAVLRENPDPSKRLAILRSYYKALPLLTKHRLLQRELYLPDKPALFKEVDVGKASIFVTFGGQGNVEDYFAELVTVFETYEAIARPFAQQAAEILRELSTCESARDAHASKIDLMSWLDKPDTRPSTQALLATDLSFPIIGLTQLLNYWVMLKVLDMSPGEILKYFVGATGHSQGVITSVVISASTTEDEFLENSRTALRLLFWIGLRSRLAHPETSISPNILQDSLAHNEGVPTPMLVVNGLRIAEVQKHVDATNAHLAKHQRINISLINGPRAVICTGPPQSLYGLNVALRKHKAEPGQDQSRVPFSQRKIRFTSRFLPVAVPFHGEHLKDVPNMVAQDVESFKCSFDGVNLAIPVFNTNTGEDLRKCERLTASLVDQICVQPVHWEVATSLKTTHVLDFGPGGASGVGGLTHRNKEGSGVQVILAASFEGTSDLLDKSYVFDYDPNTVTYAPNWAEKYRPKLVRIANTNRIHIDTPFSRLLGKPPLMVAGMTPCTVDERFVSATINAGYHIELAGGGQHTEQ
ncbi:beta subunit of fatty acid synthetase, partial [Quaeritorhiza haematococci]